VFVKCFSYLPKNTNCIQTRQNVRFMGKPVHLTNIRFKPIPCKIPPFK
jgi:hypothetical protein